MPLIETTNFNHLGIVVDGVYLSESLVERIRGRLSIEVLV